MRLDRKTGRPMKEDGHWGIVTAWREHGLKPPTKGVLAGAYMSIAGMAGFFLVAGWMPPYHGVLSRIAVALMILGGPVSVVFHYLEKARQSRDSADR